MLMEGGAACQSDNSTEEDDDHQHDQQQIEWDFFWRGFSHQATSGNVSTTKPPSSGVSLRSRMWMTAETSVS